MAKKSQNCKIVAVWIIAIVFVMPMFFKTNSIIRDVAAKKEYHIEQIGNYVTLIGDSISEQSQAELRDTLPGVDLEAVGGIRFYDRNEFGDGGYARLKKHAMRDLVAFLLGSNGGVTEEQLEEVYNYVGPKRKLILMTVYRGNMYDKTLIWNDRITNIAKRHDNIYLMDWFSENTNNEKKYLIRDRLHPNEMGRKHFAEMVRKTAIKALDLTK